jgi:hypothetical protein
MGALDELRCGLCGPRSLRQGVDLRELECCSGFRRLEVDKYVECGNRSCRMKMSMICMRHWASEYELTCKTQVKEGEFVVDQEGFWETLASRPWEDKNAKETAHWRPATTDRSGMFKISCMNCEDSMVEASVRPIEPGFAGAKPHVEEFEVPELIVAVGVSDQGVDGADVSCQYDVVRMYPLVDDDACRDYFKGAHDQPGVCPGVLLTTPRPATFHFFFSSPHVCARLLLHSAASLPLASRAPAVDVNIRGAALPGHAGTHTPATPPGGASARSEAIESHWAGW